MFEEWRKRLAKRDTDESEEITFKGSDDSGAKTDAGANEPAPSKVATDESKAESMELKVFRPESYGEVSAVADSLLAGCTVFLNLEALDRATMVKMLDFLNGVTYCTDGEIKMVAKTTFVITPHTGVDISDM